MLKKYLEIIVTISLLSTSTLINAAPTVGEWTAKFWDDSTTSNTVVATWNICIQNGGNWYISSGFSGWKGNWFSKGNDTHLQVVRSNGMQAASFDISRINNTTLSGYYKWIDNNAGTSGYHTTLITYKGATCAAYVP